MLEDGVAAFDAQFGGHDVALCLEQEIVVAVFAEAGFEKELTGHYHGYPSGMPVGVLSGGVLAARF